MKFRSLFGFHRNALAALLVALVVGLCLYPAQAIAKPAQQVNGKTIGEWSAKWWQWISSIPNATNPLTGGDCEQNQKGPVFFLAGTQGGAHVTRDCDVPLGRSIFFPLVNLVYYNAFADPLPYPTEAEKRAILNDVMAFAESLTCTVDGVPVVFNPVSPIVRAQSPPFRFVLDESNSILGIPGDDPAAVSDGYWVMLPPLPKGQHTLHFTGGLEGWFMVDVTYNLTVGK